MRAANSMNTMSTMNPATPMNSMNHMNHAYSTPMNPMHVMSLRRSKDERASLRFLKWILNSARFGWCSNALLIALYGSYLLFGAYMLIESERGQVEEEDLVALSRQTVRNEILFFALYNGYISNLSHPNNPNDLANDDRISRPNGSSRTNGGRTNSTRSNPYISRDRELRLRIDKGLNELENEIKRQTSRAKLRANLSHLNETFYYVVRLLTTLGNDQTDLLLTHGTTHSKLFIVIYSFFGIPATLVLAYHHGQLLIYGLSAAIDQLQACCCKRVKRGKREKSHKKKGRESQRIKSSKKGRPKKRLESSSLTHPIVNQFDSPSRVNSLIQHSSLDSNLKFVLANRSSIMLPNIQLPNRSVNRFSLDEPYSPNEGYGLRGSVSHNELNAQSLPSLVLPSHAERRGLNSTNLIENSQFTDPDSAINLLGPSWLSQSTVGESASNSLNHLVDSMNSSTINLTNQGTFAQNLVSYNSVNNLIGRNLDELSGIPASFGRHSMPSSIANRMPNSMPNSIAYSSGHHSFGLHRPQDAAFHSFADLHHQNDFDTRSLPFQAIRSDSRHNLLRSDSYLSGICPNDQNALYTNDSEGFHANAFHMNGHHQDPYGNYPDAYRDLYQDPYQSRDVPHGSSHSLRDLRDGLVHLEASLGASLDARSSNANGNNSKSIRRQHVSPVNSPTIGKSKSDRERKIPISLFLSILALYLFMISLLVHRIERLPLLDSFTLAYLSVSLDGVAGYSPSSPHFMWINCVSVYVWLVLLLAFIRLVCTRLSTELKLIS